MNKRIFIDMDGTLAEFKKVSKLEDLYEKGYFLSLKPIPSAIEIVKLLYKNDDVKIFILSAYLSDSNTALNEKNAWINEYLPIIKPDHRIFVPCGTNKSLAIKNINKNDILIDDYTKNLFEWEIKGTGIKFLNGINHTKGTWQKHMISFLDSPQHSVNKIINIIYQKSFRERKDEAIRASETDNKIKETKVFEKRQFLRDTREVN